MLKSKNVKKYLSKYNIQSKIISIRKIKKISMNSLRIKRFNALINYCKKNDLLHLFLDITMMR